MQTKCKDCEMKFILSALLVFFILQECKFTLRGVSSNRFVLEDKAATVTAREDLQPTSEPTAHTLS